MPASGQKVCGGVVVWWCGGGGGGGGGVVVVVWWWLKPTLVFSLAQAEQFSKTLLPKPFNKIIR